MKPNLEIRIRKVMKLKIGERIECPYCEAYAVKPPSKHVEDNPIWSLPNNSPFKSLEAENVRLREAFETIRELFPLGEFKDSYEKMYFRMVKKHDKTQAIAKKALEAGEQRDCDNCSITGLLCPIRNNDPPFTFPCPHWKALEVEGE